MHDTLSVTLAALADPTRRAMLAQLSKGEATVNELAEPFEISLPSISRHFALLGRAQHTIFPPTHCGVQPSRCRYVSCTTLTLGFATRWKIADGKFRAGGQRMRSISVVWFGRPEVAAGGAALMLTWLRISDLTAARQGWPENAESYAAQGPAMDLAERAGLLVTLQRDILRTIFRQNYLGRSGTRHGSA